MQNQKEKKLQYPTNQAHYLSNADTSFQSMKEDIIELREEEPTIEVRRYPERERKNKEFPGSQASCISLNG